MDKTQKIYLALYSKYVKAHNSSKKSKAVCQSEVNEKWKKMKAGLAQDMTPYHNLMEDLDEKIQIDDKKNKKGSIFALLNKQKEKKLVDEKSDDAVDLSEPAVGGSNSAETSAGTLGDNAEEVPKQDSNLRTAINEDHFIDGDEGKIYKKPCQERLQVEIENKKSQIERLEEAKNLGLSNGQEIEKKKIKALKEIGELKTKLKKLETDRKANSKLRAKRKEAVDKIKRDNPELAAALKMRDGVGRPRVECDQPLMGETLLRIATIGAAASDRRRDEIMRSVKTLDDLKNALHNLGFSVSRSALYLRLQPRNQNTIEGKKHVSTVPVKLTRPQNNLRKKHPDRMFAAETTKSVQGLCQILGPEACLYSSQDDKASVAIGKTAAKVQVPLLMNMRYRVRMPDHDFAVGSRHLLVPSVIAVCVMDPVSGQVTYSGPTLIRIRSSKHNNSSAFSHNEDMLRWAFC